MTKLRTNEGRLVKIAVQGKVANAYQWAEFEVAHDGKPFALPSTGGIVYNVRTGDATFGWEGDHIEPGFPQFWMKTSAADGRIWDSIFSRAWETRRVS